MNPPKRWYQLSMLQMLVAMAVAATFCVANSRPGVHRLVDYDASVEGGVVGQTLVSVGWPFAYEQTLWPHQRGRLLKIVGQADFQKIPYRFEINVFIAVITIIISVLLSGRICSRNAHLPRPGPIHQAAKLRAESLSDNEREYFTTDADSLIQASGAKGAIFVQSWCELAARKVV